MRKILVVSSDRAERGLLEPVMAELKSLGTVDAKWFFYDATDAVPEVVSGFDAYLRYFKPDIVVVPCDRFEITYVAARAFHQGYVVCHFHAGNNMANHPDDINRRVISCFSHIMFCNMPEHKLNLMALGEECWRIFVVGSTAFDGIVLDDSITPNEPFDLVVLHPDPVSEENTRKDLEETLKTIETSPLVVWVAGNKDRNHEIIDEYLNRLKMEYEAEDPGKSYSGQYVKVITANLPRPQFFSLLKNCRRAIGNSSSFYYELPTIDDEQKHVQIGSRNKGLNVPATVTGGSKRIAAILDSIPLDDNLRRKALTLGHK
jgi:UDP-N-acetylglucosamine 2-epimerase